MKKKSKVQAIDNQSEQDMARLDRALGKKGLSHETILLFRKMIYESYRRTPRDLPWRKTRSPYRLLVSEFMLQQTQVERVMDKYILFVRTFPDFRSLAQAQLREVLAVWQGLGYNRRAVALQKTAQIVMEQYNGKLPSDPGELMKLPGIGKYSASAIAAFAHNLPALFIETNIRRVFIHFFFRDKENIRDPQIMPLLESTLDTSSPREWYYALMDYGAMLKKAFPNPNRKSAHYRKQTRFHGSNRQIRGIILKTLLINPGCTKKELLRIPGIDPKRLEDSLEQLLKEGFMKKKGSRFFIE